MTSRRFSLVLVSSCSSLLVPLCQAQEISLFNGRDLSGWKGLASIWSVKDGAITGKLTSKNNPGGNTFIVWQGGEVADFDLTCKYKLKAENPEGRANSGIQFRANYTNEALFEMHGYQAEMDPGTQAREQFPEGGGLNGCLMEDGGPGGALAHVGQKAIIHFAPPPPTGAQGRIEVVGTLAPDAVYQKLYRPNDWNDYRIIAVGNHIQIFVNGQQTVDAIDEINRATSGLLGLQIHCYNKGPKTVQFKDLKLRVLKGSGAIQQLPTAATPAFSATVQTDANQPRIEVIKDQGPNSAEWALTPLDEAIPADIRQNLTFLREDLLDEGKKAAKASPEAYKLASDYCDKLLAALDQRDVARANAGYAAAQADANKRSSNQALDARRNYKMSWPQFSREESQRAALRENETDKADVKKQRLKVEWTTRAVQMRSYLDGVYRQLRETMR